MELSWKSNDAYLAAEREYELAHERLEKDCVAHMDAEYDYGLAKKEEPANEERIEQAKKDLNEIHIICIMEDAAVKSAKKSVILAKKASVAVEKARKARKEALNDRRQAELCRSPNHRLDTAVKSA